MFISQDGRLNLEQFAAAIRDRGISAGSRPPPYNKTNGYRLSIEDIEGIRSDNFFLVGVNDERLHF